MLARKKYKKCVDCKVEILNRHKHAKRCYDCTDKIRQKYMQYYGIKWRERMKTINQVIEWINDEIKRLEGRQVEKIGLQEKISIGGSILTLKKLKNKIRRKQNE